MLKVEFVESGKIRSNIVESCKSMEGGPTYYQHVPQCKYKLEGTHMCTLGL